MYCLSPECIPSVSVVCKPDCPASILLVGPDTISAVSFKVYCMVIIIICLFFMKFTKIFGKLGKLESLNSLGLGVALGGGGGGGGGGGVGMGLWGVAFAYHWCNLLQCTHSCHVRPSPQDCTIQRKDVKWKVVLMDEKLEANNFLLMLGQVAYDIEDNLPPLVIFKGDFQGETMRRLKFRPPPPPPPQKKSRAKTPPGHSRCSHPINTTSSEGERVSCIISPPKKACFWRYY